MNLDHTYLANIHNLVTEIIPLNICKYYSFLPISIDDRIPRRVLFAMVYPENMIACDTLKKYVHRRNYKYKKSYITPKDYQRLINLYVQYIELLEQENKLKLCLKSLKYNKNGSNRGEKNLASSEDLILGGQQKQNKKSQAILGGIEGIKYRLRSRSLPVKIQALHDCLKYPQQCQLILLETIKHKKGLMVWVAYSLLSQIPSPETKKFLTKYQLKLNQESLSGINLEKVNLKNINLLNSNLNFANFRGAIINEKTKLKPQLLLQWQMVNQGLTDADLSKVTFSQANLSYSNLRNINFRDCQFLQVQLTNVKLENLDFVASKIVQTNLENSNLIYIDFKNANLSQVSFVNSYLDKISLSQASLSEINFQNSKLNNIDFYGSVLKKINFSGAILTNVNLKNIAFQEINFNQARLDNVDMSYLDLSQVKINLNHLDLRYSKFVRTNFQGLNLSHSNLSHGNLSGANLSGVNLSNANLDHAKLTLAIFDCHTVFPANFDPYRAGAIIN